LASFSFFLVIAIHFLRSFLFTSFLMGLGTFFFFPSSFFVSFAKGFHFASFFFSSSGSGQHLGVWGWNRRRAANASEGGHRA